MDDEYPEETKRTFEILEDHGISVNDFKRIVEMVYDSEEYLSAISKTRWFLGVCEFIKSMSWEINPGISKLQHINENLAKKIDQQEDEIKVLQHSIAQQKATILHQVGQNKQLVREMKGMETQEFLKPKITDEFILANQKIKMLEAELEQGKKSGFSVVEENPDSGQFMGRINALESELHGLSTEFVNAKNEIDVQSKTIQGVTTRNSQLLKAKENLRQAIIHMSANDTPRIEVLRHDINEAAKYMGLKVLEEKKKAEFPCIICGAIGGYDAIKKCKGEKVCPFGMNSIAEIEGDPDVR